MPALLIRTIASAPPSSTAPYLILGGYLVPIALVSIVATVYAEEDYKGPKKSRSSIAMASAYGNVIMLGIPLAFAQFGPASATTVALIVLVHSPVLFLAAALQAEFEEARSGSVAREAIVVPRHIAKVVHTGAMIATNLGRALGDVFVDLVTDPIIIGIGVGLLLRSSGAAVPLMADKALSLLGQATLPCVLLAIGFGLSTFKLKGEIGVIQLAERRRPGNQHRHRRHRQGHRLPVRPEPGRRPALGHQPVPAAGGDLHRGPSVPAAQGRGLARHGPGAAEEQPDNGAVQGASTLTQQYVKNYLFLVKAKTDAREGRRHRGHPDPQAARGQAGAGPGERAEQAVEERDPGALPEPGGVRTEHLRRRGRVAALLRRARLRPVAAAGRAAGRHGQQPEQVQPARPRPCGRCPQPPRPGARRHGADRLRSRRRPRDEAKKTNLDLNPQATPNGCINAPAPRTNGYFCQYVLDYLEQAGFTEAQLADGGYTIRTTLDPNAMKDAKAAVNAQADPGSSDVQAGGQRDGLVEPGLTTRRVLALVANRPYGLNAAKGQTVLRLTTTFAPLGAGSTFKIFTAAAAMEQGLGTQTTIGVPETYSPLVADARVQELAAATRPP